MVSYATSHLIFCAVLFSVISSSLQIKCFVCRNFDAIDANGGDTNFPKTRCPSKWTPENMTDCPPESTQCLKVDNYLSGKRGSGIGALRLCSSFVSKEYCATVGSDEVQCYYCNRDGCNAASDIYSNSGGSYNGITFTPVFMIISSALFISKLV